MLLVAEAIGAVAAAPAIFPPLPGERPAASDALEQARAALYAGDADKAFRLLQEARPALEGDPSWIWCSALDAAALGRPFRSAELLASAPSGKNFPKLARAVLDRLAAPLPTASFKPEGASWPGLGPQSLKGLVALRPSNDGGLIVAMRDQVQLFSSSGQLLANQPLPSIEDLNLDPAGLPVALGKGQFFLADHLVTLPPSVTNGSSIAVTPGSKVLVLEPKAGAFFILDARGTLVDRKLVAVDEPGKIRTDAIGRIYITSKRERSVTILNGDMSPLKVFRPKEAGFDVRRLDDLQVDPFGDMLLVDERHGDLFLFSYDGKLLARNGEGGGYNISAAGWDGLSGLLYYDERLGAAGRLSW